MIWGMDVFVSRRSWLSPGHRPSPAPANIPVSPGTIRRARLLVITGNGPCQAPVAERPPLCSRLRTEGAMSKIDDIDSPARYRRLARDCLEMARTVASEGPRATLVEMAQIWMRLAGTEEGRQVAQQQQQTQPKADDKKE
jgi:hypothetical protein